MTLDWLIYGTAKFYPLTRMTEFLLYEFVTNRLSRGWSERFCRWAAISDIPKEIFTIMDPGRLMRWEMVRSRRSLGQDMGDFFHRCHGLWYSFLGFFLIDMSYVIVTFFFFWQRKSLSGLRKLSLLVEGEKPIPLSLEMAIAGSRLKRGQFSHQQDNFKPQKRRNLTILTLKPHQWCCLTNPNTKNVSFCVIFALELLLRAVAYRKNFLMGEAWSSFVRQTEGFWKESHNHMTKKEAEF